MKDECSGGFLIQRRPFSFPARRDESKAGSSCRKTMYGESGKSRPRDWMIRVGSRWERLRWNKRVLEALEALVSKSEHHICVCNVVYISSQTNETFLKRSTIPQISVSYEKSPNKRKLSAVSKSGVVVIKLLHLALAFTLCISIIDDWSRLMLIRSSTCVHLSASYRVTIGAFCTPGFYT